MAFSNEMPVPSYVIYRETVEGQLADPTTVPLAFFPPKDSDELFDALRAKYSHLKSHSERMREAVIEFLLEETQLPQVPMEELPTPQTAQSTNTSPWQASMQSMTSDSSTWSSPDMLGLATPSFGNSPQPQMQSLSRQFSTANSSNVASTEPTPPAIEQMTGVFSLSDAAQPKQRVRRKMTEAEKVEYRKRRIVKACEKCSKRKRKCHHNQPEMENTGATKGGKVTKPHDPGSKKSAVQTPHQFENAFAASDMQFTDPFTADISMAPFEDFADLLENPLPDVSFDEFLATDPTQFPWSETPDWTLMEPATCNFVMDHTINARAGKAPMMSGHHSGVQTQHLNGLHESPNNGMLWEHLRTGQLEELQQLQQRQQPTHTPHVHDTDGLDAFVFEDSGIAARVSRGGGSSKTSPQKQRQLVSGAQQEAHNSDAQASQALRLQTSESRVCDTTRTQDGQIAASGPRANSGDNVTATGILALESNTGGIQRVDSTAKMRNPSDPAGASANEDINPVSRSRSSGEDTLALRRSSTRQEGKATSLGSSAIATAASPSTEMYMLRRRIPKALHSIVDRSNGTATSTGLGSMLQRTGSTSSALQLQQQQTEVNGGAYQRLLANNNDAPVHTRPRNPSASGFSGDTDQNATTIEARHARMPTPEVAAADDTPYTVRLRDTHRRRDHFGRPIATNAKTSSSQGMETLVSLAALGCLLLVFSMLPASTTHNLGLLVLALVSPISDEAKDTPEDGLVNQLVRCTIKNSSWLAENEDREGSWAATSSWSYYLRRLLYRGCRYPTSDALCGGGAPSALRRGLIACA